MCWDRRDVNFGYDWKGSSGCDDRDAPAGEGARGKAPRVRVVGGQLYLEVGGGVELQRVGSVKVKQEGQFKGKP